MQNVQKPELILTIVKSFYRAIIFTYIRLYFVHAYCLQYLLKYNEHEFSSGSKKCQIHGLFNLSYRVNSLCMESNSNKSWKSCRIKKVAVNE